MLNSNFMLHDGSEVILPRIMKGAEGFWAPEEFSNNMHHTSYDSISSSGLSDFNESPFCFFEKTKRKQNGMYGKKKKALEFGSIAHLIVLEPHEFRKRVVMMPDFGQKKTDKLDRDIWLSDQHPNAVIFKSNEEGKRDYENYMGIVRAITNHEKARDIFSVGVSERSGFYSDPATGLWSRFRPDHFTTGSDLNILSDFKTSRSIKYKNFQRAIHGYCYDVQLAHYYIGYKELNGKYPNHYCWVVSQNEFPFEVSIFDATDAMIEFSIKKREKLMSRLLECIESRHFPQAQETVTPMHPSAHEINDFEFEEEVL